MSIFVSIYRARRVLKALNHPKDYHVDFKEFASYSDRFPAAYSPIFNLQNAMRKKVRLELCIV